MPDFSVDRRSLMIAAAAAPMIVTAAQEAAQAQVPAHSYSPREVKTSVAGYGAASKQQMQPASMAFVPTHAWSTATRQGRVCRFIRTATSVIKSPIPENSAIEINS